MLSKFTEKKPELIFPKINVTLNHFSIQYIFCSSTVQIRQSPVMQCLKNWKQLPYKLVMQLPYILEDDPVPVVFREKNYEISTQ